MRILVIQPSELTAGAVALVVALTIVVAGPAVKAEREGEAPVARANAYFIDIGVMAEQDLVRKMIAVQNGSTVESVIETLGEPDVDKNLVDKRRVFVARRLYYYSKKASRRLVNEKEDRYLALDFDARGRLIAKWERLGPHKRRSL